MELERLDSKGKLFPIWNQGEEFENGKENSFIYNYQDDLDLEDHDNAERLLFSIIKIFRNCVIKIIDFLNSPCLFIAK